MRKTLPTSAAMLGLALCSPALAQSASWPWAHQPGTGESGPASSAASNIDAADAHSAIAPHLPAPAQGDNAGPAAYLRDAQHALMRNQTGLAQQSLEMAETRLLDRSTLPSQAGTPDQSPEIREVSAALDALGRKDIAGARHAIQVALARFEAPMGKGGPGMAGPASYTPDQYNGGMAPPPSVGMAPPAEAVGGTAGR